MAADLIVARPEGLYRPPGDFYIDPWRPVSRAVITHAHSDHARFGHEHYPLRRAGARRAAGAAARHHAGYAALRRAHYPSRGHAEPASGGHVLGSAQVRLERGGQVWVASGDYKVEDDGTCVPFEPVRCDTFITESTFGLPIYRWQSRPPC
jgi:putative mRNA 3-end processing factor